MPDISFGEILVICLVALLVIGPEELPKVIKSVSRYYRAFRKTTREFKHGFVEMLEQEEVADAVKEIKDGKSLAKSLITGDDGKTYAAYDISDIEDTSRKKSEAVKSS